MRVLIICFLLLLLFSPAGIFSQQIDDRNALPNAPAPLNPTVNAPPVETITERERLLLRRIDQLETRLADVETRLTAADKTAPPNAASTAADAPQSISIAAPAEPSRQAISPSPPAQNTGDKNNAPDFLRDTTINFAFDGYYSFNFNRPYNRANLLRAYDVSSNSFSLSQASLILENAPNLAQNRRFGFRFDLQYGQATETVQGNPNNELRPQVYRPVWQAYGTYVAPVGKGLTVDFGKWAGALGYETNYAKDNLNYSRSYYFNFLPFYHFGIRATYPINDKLTATYWLVNGTQQSEDFNGFKSQAILLTYKPERRVTLQGNYYVGREQRDQQLVAVATPGGTTLQRIIPRGRFHVLDAYATFLATDKLTLAFEGDYVVNRVQSNDTPARVAGGAAYLRYQWTKAFALAARTEYLSDRGGLFSGTTQSLKEFTFTGEYKFAEGFLMRGEYRRDWSNRPYFLTERLDALRRAQNTATIGLLWWFGNKPGAW